jgi:hypothetical protein
MALAGSDSTSQHFSKLEDKAKELDEPHCNGASASLEVLAAALSAANFFACNKQEELRVLREATALNSYLVVEGACDGACHSPLTSDDYFGILLKIMK